MPNFKLEDIYDSKPVKVIHDYNSGVGFVINKENGNCTTYPLNPEGIESLEINIVSSNFGSFFELKKPMDYFGLETQAFYAGQVCIFSVVFYKFLQKINFYLFCSDMKEEFFAMYLSQIELI